MIDFEARLEKMKSRRHGVDLGLEAYDSTGNIFTEDYQRINEANAVKYVYGAMQAVDSRYTRVTIEEGERVANTLIDMLKTDGVCTEHRIQGSVALDIHIKGHSDIDMLIIKEDIVLVQTPKIDGTKCYSSDNRSMVDMVAEIRNKSEVKLTSRYYSADVDCSNAKSISLSGGSLQRKVDIVPSCWYNTHEYQRSCQEYNRGIEIYDKRNHILIANYPFKHIKRVNDKDNIYGGNLKKLVRLLKNLVADMPDYKKSKVKKLSSYDLTSIVFHMNDKLNAPVYYPLTLVARLNQYLHYLKDNFYYRNSLDVPDDTRKVFDKEIKYQALETLCKEVDDLTTAVGQAINPYTYDYNLNESLSNKRVELYY